MDIPDDSKDFKVLDSNALDQIRQRTEILNRINNCIPVHTVTYKPPEVVIPPNPIHETNRLLEEQNDNIADLSTKLEEANSEISKQTKELKSIHYENLKLNAQIDTLNKTIDSQNDELERLRNINAELKLANKTLEKSNKSNRGYWIKTILIGIFTTVLGFLLGKYL